MKVTVCFDNIRVVVPCGDGTLFVKDLMREAILRYKKATGKNDAWLTINSLSSLTGGGLLDPDDRLCDVADDREQIVAHFLSGETQIHVGGDGASSVGTNSPDFFHSDHKEQHYVVNARAAHHTSSHIKRESAKRLSMHSLSTKEPLLTTYSAQSLPRESRRKEPLGQDSKSYFDLAVGKNDNNYYLNGMNEAEEVVIKNEAGPLGLHVVPCYDLLGNDQGLRVERIESNGRIARDGQIELHDKIIKINGHNLLHVPFSKVQDIFLTAMNEPCLNISVMKNRKLKRDKNSKNYNSRMNNSKIDSEESVKKPQSSNHNSLQTANTRKIGRMIEIELTKGTNGLGFSVTTRDNPAGGHCPIYIKNILPKGAAVEDGRLKPGDRLLEVNNMEMTGKNQAEVVSLLRSIPPGGRVKIVVSRQEEVTSSGANDSQLISSYVSRELTVSSQSNESTDSLKYWNTPTRSPVQKKDVVEEPEKTEPVQHGYAKSNVKGPKHSEEVVLSPRKNRMILTLDIPVHDSEKAGLGVSVKGKTSSADDNSSVDLGIFIKSVLHGGAASRDGRLRTNDQLLNVNGVSLLGLSNSDAMETLRRAMLNTNSPFTGIITLTIARRVSSYDGCEKIFSDSISSSKSKSDLINRIYIGDNTSKQSENHVREKNDLNSQSDVVDNGQIGSATSASPWNPVIDRLTEQYNKNSLRNESYCIATNKTWMDGGNKAQKLSLIHKEDSLESILAEESIQSKNEGKKQLEDKDSQYSEDPTYDSQLSLEELNSAVNKFSRDALGRQSMSEKRHAALDAKNTDTYKRNKKLREGREVKTVEPQSKQNSFEDSAAPKKVHSIDNLEKIRGKTILQENAFLEDNKNRNKKINEEGKTESDYLYTIPGRNKFISPRKHWLVDDVQGEISDANNYRSDNDGFSNSRGDVKQASLNSALDDRYKRSRKKGGIRSMLRLGKNRKSLNFGDNIESRQEANNYCSGTINYIA